jgi:HlyD family secretion protein
LAPQTVQNVVTYTAVIQVDNPELKLKPGMTANITAIVAERENVTTIPNAALRFRPGNGGRTAWKIDGEQLTPAPLKLGITDGAVTEVVSGLQPGDHVAVAQAADSKKPASNSMRNPMMPMGGGGRGGRR